MTPEKLEAANKLEHKINEMRGIVARYEKLLAHTRGGSLCFRAFRSCEGYGEGTSLILSTELTHIMSKMVLADMKEELAALEQEMREL